MRKTFSRQDLIDLRETQHQAFHTAAPGLWHDKMSLELELAEFDDVIITLGLQNGKHVGFHKDGSLVRDVTTVEKEDDDGNTYIEEEAGDNTSFAWRGFNLELASSMPPGCAPCIGEVAGARYAAGVLIAAGKGDSGKTPFVHALGLHIAESLGEKYRPIRFGEPLSGYHSNFDTFILELGEALLTNKVIVIDSIKDIIGSAGGNTTTGGLSRGAFQLLSDIGIIAATRGCIVITSLNPTSDDAKVLDLVNEAVRSNATSLASSNDKGQTWDIITRTGEGLPRLKHTLSAVYANRIMDFGNTNSAKNNTKDFSAQNEISEEELEGAIRRMYGNTSN